MSRQCLACGGDQPKSGYNTAQWRKGPGLGRCKACFAAAASGASPPQLPPIRQRQHVDVRVELTHSEFVERYKHKRPVILRGLAKDWAALARWGNVEHLSSLHDKDVLVLRSPDSRHFLKRTCAHYWGPFGNVAEVRERLTSYFQRLTSYGGRCGRFQCRCVRRRALRR